MDEINKLEDVRPGDIMFGPIGGLVGLGVGLGQLALGEAFRIGRLSVRHVGIVVKGAGPDYGTQKSETMWSWQDAPRLVQAMPHGAEEIEMHPDTHWTPRHAYVRLPEDYPGQSEDAAAVARLMVREGVAYSLASYLALALWRWGWQTPRLEAWINRRQSAGEGGWTLPSGRPLGGHPETGKVTGLPVEAICSVLVDQAWTLAGKRVMVGTEPQVVTPGAMAEQLWHRPGVVWGGAGLL